MDGTTLSTDDFWARCAASSVLPETSAPSPGAFQEAFLAAADDGYDGVLCHQPVRGGVGHLPGSGGRGQGGGRPHSGAGHRLPLVDHGPRAHGPRPRRDGRAPAPPSTSWRTRVDSLIPRTKVFGVLDTLEHLEKGGRIGGARALLGSLLSIKPVVTLVDGVVEEESKQRTRSRSLRYLADKAADWPPPSAAWRCATARPATSTSSSPCSRTSTPSTRWWWSTSVRWSAPTPAPAPSGCACIVTAD